MAGKPDSLKPETLAANALGWIDEKTGAIVPAIHPSTTYLRELVGGLDGGHGGFSLRGRRVHPPFTPSAS